jgi:hypothetical protein
LEVSDLILDPKLPAFEFRQMKLVTCGPPNLGGNLFLQFSMPLA